MLGMMFSGIPIVEARRHKQDGGKKMAEHKKIDCSSNQYCDPFSPKIALGCQESGKCQERCNQFGGVFLCSVQQGYCKCAMET